MTTEQLRQLILEQRGAVIVSVVTETQPKMRKKSLRLVDGVEIVVPNPFLGAVRLAKHNGMIGAKYQNAVNNRREKEGKERDFEAERLPWGQHDGSYLIKHKGRSYLKFYPKSTLSDDYILPNGSHVDPKLIDEFLSDKEEGGRQDLDRPVRWRTITLENIREITFGGNRYKVDS